MKKSLPMCACMVSGPMSGFTMLDSLRRLPATRWMEDDRSHPLPILRPRIYTMTMRAMAGYVDAELAEILLTTARCLDDATGALAGGVLPGGWSSPGARPPTHACPATHRGRGQSSLCDDLALRPQGDQPGRLWTQPPYGFEHTSRGIEDVLRNLTGAPPGYASGRHLQPSGAAQSGLWAEGQQRSTWIGNWRDGDAAAVCVLEQAGWNPWWLAVLSAGFWTTEGLGGQPSAAKLTALGGFSIPGCRRSRIQPLDECLKVRIANRAPGPAPVCQVATAVTDRRARVQIAHLDERGGATVIVASVCCISQA